MMSLKAIVAQAAWRRMNMPKWQASRRSSPGGGIGENESAHHATLPASRGSRIAIRNRQCG